MQRETRFYPVGCTSAFCGKGSASCPSCPHYPTLKRFEEWRDATQAVRLDPIWSPTAYTATVGGERAT